MYYFGCTLAPINFTIMEAIRCQKSSLVALSWTICLRTEYNCISLYVNFNVAFLDWVCRFNKVNMYFNKIHFVKRQNINSYCFSEVAIPSVHHSMRNTHCLCIRRQNRSYFLSFTLSNHHDSDQYTIGDKISSSHFPDHFIIVNKRIYPLIIGTHRQRRTRTGVVSVYHNC
jgi:hypothetical protein